MWSTSIPEVRTRAAQKTLKLSSSPRQSSWQWQHTRITGWVVTMLTLKGLTPEGVVVGLTPESQGDRVNSAWLMRQVSGAGSNGPWCCNILPPDNRDNTRVSVQHQLITNTKISTWDCFQNSSWEQLFFNFQVDIYLSFYDFLVAKATLQSQMSVS